jgi:hypothetical protein
MQAKYNRYSCYDTRHVLMFTLVFLSIIPRGLSSFIYYASVVMHTLQGTGFVTCTVQGGVVSAISGVSAVR